MPACPNMLIGLKNTIIAVGFAGALRRSEICNLIVDDVEFLDSRENDRVYHRIHDLCEVPARVRFLSCEPPSRLKPS